MIRSAKDKPCTDCGVQYPYYVMQFDHVDPKFKTQSFDKLTLWTNREKLQAEIDKCEVVCANCHMERTHGPLQRNGRVNLTANREIV